MATLFKESFNVAKDNFTTAGEASSRIKRILKQLDVDAAIIRKVAICSYELELNLVIHSLGGELSLEVTESGLTIRSDDIGPGIPNMELAMTEGYSTASEYVRMMGFGAGMGLPNTKRHCDDFFIQSEVGKGTHIRAEYSF